MNDITFINDKQALLDMCLRNATKLAIGDIEINHDLRLQLDFAYHESNEQTKELLDALFRNKGLLDGV